jgi:luciferase family oxidoreductase group 1
MSRLANTPLSVLDLAPLTASGKVADAYRNMVELARLAERLGYTRFWLAEHHNIPGITSAATAVLIGHVAGATSSIRVGAGGIMLPNHAPLVIAETFGTLETLYPGRIDLGLGRAPGTDQVTMRALRRNTQSTGSDFPALVQELMAFLAPPRPDQRVRAIPGAGIDVPLWILGSSTFGAQLAALLGLRYAFAGQFAPAAMLDALAIYRRTFKPSPSLDRPYAMVGVPVIAAETDAEARRLSTTPQQKILNLVRGRLSTSGTPPPPVDSMDDLWDEHERAEVQQFLGAAVIGGPETVKAGLERFLEITQADELMLHSDFYHHADRMRSYEIVADVWQRSSQIKEPAREHTAPG